MLTKHGYAVGNAGELVSLKIGAWSCTLEFAVALFLSALLKREARYAKASAGFDGWYKKSTIGILTDANAPKWRQDRWKKLPERLAKVRIFVKAQGQLVQVRLGEVRIEMPFNEATKLSQHLRVHGRLARNFGGEKADWYKIAMG